MSCNICLTILSYFLSIFFLTRLLSLPFPSIPPPFLTLVYNIISILFFSFIIICFPPPIGPIFMWAYIFFFLSSEETIEFIHIFITLLSMIFEYIQIFLFLLKRYIHDLSETLHFINSVQPIFHILEVFAPYHINLSNYIQRPSEILHTIDTLLIALTNLILLIFHILQFIDTLLPMILTNFVHFYSALVALGLMLYYHFVTACSDVWSWTFNVLFYATLLLFFLIFPKKNNHHHPVGSGA